MHSKNQRRHGSPCPSRGPVVSMKPKEAVAPTSGPAAPLPFRVPRDYPHSRFNKAPLAVYPPKGARGKTCVSLPVVSLEKMPCLGRTEGGAHVRINCPPSTSPSPVKPTLTPPALLRGPQEKLVNGRGPPTPRSTTPPTSADRRPSPAHSPMDKRPSFSPSPSPRTPAPPSPLDRKQQNGTKNPGPNRRLSGRVFDPNKHCGVQDPESKRPCTRSLTCKTHSLTHRRAVPGRRKHFDILLAEHKGRAKEKDGAKEKEKEGLPKRELPGGRQGTLVHDTTPSAPPPHCHSSRTVSTLKLRLASTHTPRVPGGPAGLPSTPIPPAPTLTQDLQPPIWQRVGGDQRSGADRESHLSSDEGDPVTPDPDRGQASCHYSSHHPQPLGYCTFSSRLMGRGHYVFDRRWDRMRLALHRMVEKHVNAQLWRKVPLAAEGPIPLWNPPAGITSCSNISPPPLPCFPPSTNGAFSLVSYPDAFPQEVSATGFFTTRDPSRHPVATTAIGKPCNGTTVKPVRTPFPAKKRAGLVSSSDPHRRNGIGYHTTSGALCTSTSPLDARRKTLGRSVSDVGIGVEDWYPDPITTTPYPVTRDQPSPLPPNPNPIPHRPSPLAYRAGVEGRKRRSPSVYGGGKHSKVTKPATGLDSIFRMSPGLLASGPESPPQSKLHH